MAKDFGWYHFFFWEQVDIIKEEKREKREKREKEI
jgi:hypothetical protein